MLLWRQAGFQPTIAARRITQSSPVGISLRESFSQSKTALFTVLTFSEIAIALALRSSRDSLFKIGLFSNPQLLAAVGLTIGLQLAVIYLPFCQSIFQTQPLSWRELGLSIVISTVTFWLVELKKSINN